MRSKALTFIFLLGIVSLFADITYEGARGITGPFLYTLGASAWIVGLVGGIGEFVGYSFRLISGYIADKTKLYWPLAFLGYLLNLLSVPLLSFAKSWEFASFLIISERFGKAIRAPARDTIISFASSNIGLGKGFAIHEALDQIGAVLGPLFVAFVLARSKNYHEAFLFLGIPAIISLAFLTLSIFLYPKPEGIEAKTEKLEIFPASSFKPYILFVFLTVLGFPHFQILSYHLKSTGTLQDETIPLLFALAMGLDAIFGLLAGFSFDRFKLRILFLLPILSAPITLFGFLFKGIPSVIMAVSLWGFVMGIHETVLKSAVAYIVPKERRAGAFGVFHTIYGVSWFLGSAVFGFLYELSVYYLLAFALISQILAFFVLIRMRK